MNGNNGLLNDLWEFNPTLGTMGEWTWMGSSSTIPIYLAAKPESTAHWERQPPPTFPEVDTAP